MKEPAVLENAGLLLLQGFKVYSLKAQKPQNKEPVVRLWSSRWTKDHLWGTHFTIQVTRKQLRGAGSE